MAVQTPTEPRYAVLQGSTATLSSRVAELALQGETEAEIQIPSVERRRNEWREIRHQLRAMLQVADEETLRHDRLLAALRAIVTADSPESDALRGRDVAYAGIRVLEAGLAAGTLSQPLHYSDWFNAVSEAGHSIAGKDPLATFLTALTRDARVERVGSRTGCYQLVDDGDDEARGGAG